MKKALCILLTAMLLLCLGGCSGQSKENETLVTFYYLRAELTYGSSGSVIADCQVKANTGPNDLASALAQYLAGPSDEDLVSPFPKGVRLLEIRQEADTLVLVLDESFGQLKGIALTKACACLAMTCFGLTDAAQVSIQAENATLESAKSIDILRDSLVLQENVPEST